MKIKRLSVLNLKKYILLIIFLSCLNFALNATTAPLIAKDTTTQVDVRIPSEQKIKEYKADKRFDYREEKQELSWLERLKLWLFERFNQGEDALFNPHVWKYPVIIVLALAILFFIFKLTKVKFRALFGKQKIHSAIDDINLYAENVHKMNFETLVTDAINSRNYRLAVRYLYLRNLKHLSDNMLIHWNPNKTNMSYQFEIKDANLRSKFLSITLIFDYVWYGDLMLDEQQFAMAHAQLNDFDKMIEHEK